MNVEFELLLEKLLHKYECVIIPDFGGFIVRDSPSNFNNSKTVIKPTSKHIFFNPHLVQNDGLLYNEIQLAKAFTYSEAVEYCQSVINIYKQMMRDNGSVRFGQLGTFFQGKENNFWFSPSTTLNLSLESYGLFPVDLKTKSYQENPVELETVSNIEEDVKIFEMVPDNKPLEPVERPNRVSMKAWLVAASLTLLVHFVYLKVEKTDVTTNEASLLPKVELIQNKDTVSTVPSYTMTDSTVIDTTSEIVPEILVPDQVNPTENQTSPEETSMANVTTTEAVSPEKLPEETKIETPVQTYNKVNKVAKYKLEENALSHKIDLEKTGKICKIERNGEWFEIFVEQ